MDTTHQNQILKLIDRPEEVAFLLDFDGTLVDLFPHPDKIDIPPELIVDLRTIANAGRCAFAIVSGRSLSKLEKFLPNVHIPSLGCHGAELRRRAYAPIEWLASPMNRFVRAAVRHVAEKNDCFFEDKEFSVALHLPFTHRNNDLEPEIRAAFGNDGDDFVICKIGRTYEISQVNATKGTGIEHLMELPEFKGRMPVYFGDDVYLDHSLKSVLRMGGLLIPVQHVHHDSNVVNNTGLFNSGNVREFISLLASEVGGEESAEAERKRKAC